MRIICSHLGQGGIQVGNACWGVVLSRTWHAWARSLTGKRPVSMYQDGGRDEQDRGRRQERYGEILRCYEKNTVTEEKLNFKSEALDKHRKEKAAQDARNWFEQE